MAARIRRRSDCRWGLSVVRKVSSGDVFDVGNGLDEFLRVRMLGFVEDVFGVAVFDDFAVMHDGDVVRNVAHHGEIVGDENHGEIELFAQLEQEVENLGLDGDVERADGLVCDDELGFWSQGSCDGDTLALPA